jgi:hypothetical protein
MVDDFDAWYAEARASLAPALAAWCGDAALAVDAIDEAFVRAIERWDRVRALSAPHGWVWQTAMNVVRRRQRRRRMEERLVRRRSAGQDLAVAGPTGVDVDLDRALRCLSERQRTAVVLLGRRPAHGGGRPDHGHCPGHRERHPAPGPPPPRRAPGGRARRRRRSRPPPREPGRHDRRSDAMTDLETQLRSLRYAVPDGPTAAELRARAARRRTRRRAALLAMPLLALAAVAAIRAVREDPAGDVVTGPTGDDDRSDGPVRTLGGVEGVAVTVTPAVRLRDGDVVDVRIEGVDRLPGATILLCAGDVTESDAASACDVEAVQRPESDAGLPTEAVEGGQRVALSRLIRVTRSSGAPSQPARYDCATEPAGCVLAVGPYELPARAVLVPVSFRAAPLARPAASVTPATDLTDGQPVTLVVRDLSPNRTYDVGVCQPTAGMCDEIDGRPTAVSDAAGTLETVVVVRTAIYGWQGRAVCVSEGCTVVVVDRGDRLVEAPIAFAPGAAAPIPRLVLDPPGPHTAGREVTIHGSGFRPGYDLGGHLGQCPANLDTAIEERCVYPSELRGPIVVAADGTVTASFRPTGSLVFTGSCVGGPGCVVAWVIPHGPIGASAPLAIEP